MEFSELYFILVRQSEHSVLSWDDRTGNQNCFRRHAWQLLFSPLGEKSFNFCLFQYCQHVWRQVHLYKPSKITVKLQIGIFNQLPVIPQCNLHVENEMKLVSLIIQIHARQVLTFFLHPFLFLFLPFLLLSNHSSFLFSFTPI